MGFAWQRRTHSCCGWWFVSYCFAARQLFGKDQFAQPVQPPIIMMANIACGLTEFGGNLRESVPLKEEQCEGCALVLGELFENTAYSCVVVDELANQIGILPG